MGLLDFLKKVENPISKKWIARLDNKPEFMHIELGLNEKLENGRPRILAHDMVTVDEVLDLFIQFYNAQIIDTTEWYVLK